MADLKQYETFESILLNSLNNIHNLQLAFIAKTLYFYKNQISRHPQRNPYQFTIDV